MKRETFKPTFYREGFTYSLVIRRNALAGYAVSRNGRISHYEIFAITARKDCIEYLIESQEDHYMTTYAIFLKMWETLNNIADRKRAKQASINN